MKRRRREPRPSLALAALGLVVALAACSGDAPGDSRAVASGEPGGGSTPGPVISAEPPPTPTPVPAAGDATKLLGGWLPAPLHASFVGAAAEAAEGACRSAMLRAGGAFAPLAAASVILVDARGAGLVWLLFANEDAAVDCRVTLGADLVAGDTSLRAWLDLGPAPAVDGIAYVDYGVLDVPAVGEVTVTLGRAGRASLDVIATFPDESNAFTSYAEGWWLLWWHGSSAPVGIGGVDRQHVVVAGLAPPTPGP